MTIEMENFNHKTIIKIDDKYWFFEKLETEFPGQSFGLQVIKILHHSQSKYQDILIFQSATFGNVLVLNGIIQCTERDEFAYQELITHLPIMSHPNPKKVLVIGGGDCGVIRELIKHVEDDTVEQITMVEIDDQVIQLSAKYLPQMAKYHNHPKLNLIIDDGFKFLQQTLEKYQVIITDSSDPDGPATEFFQVSYFKLLLNCLDENGIVIMQSSENIWLNIKYLRDLLDKARTVFNNVQYSQCYMPSYTSGSLGLIIATNCKDIPLITPLRKFSSDKEQKLFKYYNSQLHHASFVLPTWAKNQLNC